MGPFDWLPHAPLEPLQLEWLNGVEVAVLRLDRIYLRNASSRDPKILGDKPWSHLSDHLPLAVEVHL